MSFIFLSVVFSGRRHERTGEARDVLASVVVQESAMRSADWSVATAVQRRDGASRNCAARRGRGRRSGGGRRRVGGAGESGRLFNLTAYAVSETVEVDRESMTGEKKVKSFLRPTARPLTNTGGDSPAAEGSPGDAAGGPYRRLLLRKKTENIIISSNRDDVSIDEINMLIFQVSRNLFRRGPCKIFTRMHELN